VLFRYQVRPERKFDYLNNAITDLTGFSRAEFMENPALLETIIIPEDRAILERILTDTTDGTEVMRFVCRDGMIRPFFFNFVHVVSFEREILAIEGIIHRGAQEYAPAVQDLKESPAARTAYFADKLKMVSNIGLTLAEKMSLKDIYTLLSASLIELYPDVRMITIARYHPEARQMECVSAVIANETMDVSQFPPLPLEPPGVGTQSEAIYTRKPVIVPDLIARLKNLKNVVTVDSEGVEGGSVPQSAICVPMLSRGEVLGVVQLQSAVKNRYSMEDAEILSVAANTAAVAIETASLMESLNRSRQAVEDGYNATLEGLFRALEIRDQDTVGHTDRVTKLSTLFGKRLKLSEHDLVNLMRGALIHDIGKIGVPDAILRKEGPLSSEEWQIMRKHPEDGYRILMNVPFLRNSLDVLRYHHEKWDGSGYPAGLRGEEIPLQARLFAIEDVWDALTSDRPYRKAWGYQRAVDYIRANSGAHFDPRLVTEFVKIVPAEGSSNWQA